jgi:poly(3-hydroxyalkanoate) synthetase
MSLILMNAEQLRRVAIKNAEQKLEEQKNFQTKVEQMSKHNVGGLYDIRAIKKSKAFKEQKEYFDIEKVQREFEDMLTYNRLITKKQKFIDFLTLLGKSADDPHQLRVWTKIVDEIVGEVKERFNVKD